VVILLIIGILGIFFYFSVNSILKKTLFQQHERRAISIASNLASQVVEPLLTSNMSQLQLLLKNTRNSEEDIVYLYIFDAQGQVPAHTFTGGFPRDFKRISILTDQRSNTSQLLETEKGILLDVSVPILHGSLGHTHVGLSREGILQQIKTLEQSLLLICSLASIVAILFAAFFSRRITRPLAALVQGANQLQKGKLDYRVANGSSDEIGMVTDSFNNMAASLEADRAQRIQAEEALRKSEALLNTILNNVGAYIFIKDTQYRYTYVNTKARELLGRPAEEIVGHTDEDFFSAESVEEIMQSDRPVIEEGKTVSREERDLISQDKMPRTYWTVKLPLFDDQGTIYGLCGISADITSRKEAEEKIRENEQFISNILDTVDEGFIVISPDFRILVANKAYCSQVGGCDGNIIGRHCYEVSHKINRPCYQEGEECAVRHAMDTGEPHSTLHRHKDGFGNILYVDTKAYPIKDDTGKVIYVIETINNITEKYLLEEERLKSQKLEAIGTLAGGIAHDFNNLLQGVFGYVSMAKMALNQPEKLVEMLDQVEEALSLSVNLTAQLLTFAKGGNPIKKKMNLNPVLETAAKFALSGSRCDCRMRLDPDLWLAEVDKGQIAQVIQNIVLNASEAMPEGGRIELSSQNISLPRGRRQIKISIKDTGIGIPEAYRSKIFDPYFTTKKKGSGLGLATSYSIIRNHGGSIEVESTQNEGATFIITLPAYASDILEEKPSQPDADVLKRKGRILVMDDEPMIRDVAKNMIEVLGHDIELASHGEEAIEKYREALKSGNPFDIVILDLTIKNGMGGEETIRRLHEIDPDVSAVVSSGYSDNPIVSEYQDHGFKGLLNKPYNLNELMKCLNGLLGKAINA
jgi:PAS domain S-box-containing protein